MERKFKHKILGLTASNEYNRCADGYYQIEDGEVVRASIIENSNDWEEVKEYPKIFSFRHNHSKTSFTVSTQRMDKSGNLTELYGATPFTLQEGLERGYEIYQVATSKTDVWTIGDRVKFQGTGCSDVGIISKFEYKNQELYICSATCEFHWKYVKKAPTPLFTTEDNFEIVDVLTRVYVVWNNKLTISNERFWDVQIPAEMKECKVFYNKESAEKFVDKNKPRFSVKDVEDALTMNWGRTTGDTIGNVLVLDEEKFRQKLGI